jgi:hypothetical protein
MFGKPVDKLVELLGCIDQVDQMTIVEDRRQQRRGIPCIGILNGKGFVPFYVYTLVPRSMLW